MAVKQRNPFWRVVTLGAVAGMRSMAAPALLSNFLSKNPSVLLQHSVFGLLQKKIFADGLKVLALSELAADKAAGTPDRIIPPLVMTRGLSGALAGAALYKAWGRKPFNGALLGCAVAVASTYGTFTLRKSITESTDLPDPLVGTVEDIIALQGGALVLK